MTRKLIIAGLIVVAIGLAGLWRGDRYQTVAGQQTFSLRPYLALGWTNRLQPLDPHTLRPVRGVPPITYGPKDWVGGATFFVSTVGGTVFAAIHQADSTLDSRSQITIGVFDRTGRRLAPPFHPAVMLNVDGISPDGSQLFGYAYKPRFMNGNPIAYVVLSARSGRVLYRLPLRQPCCQPTLYDPAHHRLFILREASSGRDKKPHAPTLLAYIVATGRLVARLPLPGVLAGDWISGYDKRGMPWMNVYAPGFALSPDGSRIALLDGARDSLLTIDSTQLHVLRTVNVTTPSSILGRVGAWLGLVPATAEAKEILGTQLQMSFSPDGRSLLVTGWHGSRTPNGKYAYHEIAMRRIDVEGGQVDATQKPAGNIWWSAFSGDGSAVYALSALSGSHLEFILRRYDPRSLVVEASRLVHGDDLTTLVLLRV